MRVLTILAEGFEEIEAVTVIDLLRRAEIDVTVAGLTAEKITGSHKLTIECDAALSAVDSAEYDALFLPGGQPGTRNLTADSRVIQWVKNFAAENKYLAAICAAPTVLLHAGVVDTAAVTSYPAESSRFKTDNYKEDAVVVSGRIITSRGVGTAIPFALNLIRLWKGDEAARQLARKIVFTSSF